MVELKLHGEADTLITKLSGLFGQKLITSWSLLVIPLKFDLDKI